MNLTNPIKKVIIIGAGASGIAAATRLYEQGIQNILVLEAENRIGGRVHTVDLPYSYGSRGLVEYGAQFIHGEKNNVVYELGAALNLVESNGCSFSEKCTFVKSSAELLDSEIGDKMLELCYSLTKNIDMSEVKKGSSSADYFISRLEEGFDELHLDQKYAALKTEYVQWCHQLINSLDGSESWFDSAISTIDEYEDCEGDLLTIWRESYRSLFSLLLGKCLGMTNGTFVNEHIITYKPVKKMSLINDLVRVECADGDSYLANHVILTVSLGVLKEKYKEMFDGIVLPEKKILAIENLGFSSVNKIFIKFPRQCLPESINCLYLLWSEEHKKEYAEQGLEWLTDIFALHRTPHAADVLCGWVVGPSSRKIEQLSVSDIQQQITGLLQRLLGSNFDIQDPEYCLSCSECGHKRCSQPATQKSPIKLEYIPLTIDIFRLWTNYAEEKSIELKLLMQLNNYRTTWSSNKHFKGVYSYRTPASEELGITSEFLSSPITNKSNIPIILFAGEATHPHYYSTVHGAVETGWREADRILSLNEV